MSIFCFSAVLSLIFYGIKKHFNSNDKRCICTYSTLLDKPMHLKMSYLIFKAQKFKICLFLFHFDVEDTCCIKGTLYFNKFWYHILKLRSTWTKSFWTMNERNKVHIFWEGQKILRNQFTLFLSYRVPVKSKVKNSQNFMAFSEYMNYTKRCEFRC